MVHGLQGKGGRGGKAALYQPLALLELVCHLQPNREIHRIREARPLHHLQGIRADPYKNIQAIFLTEMLNKCLKEESEQPELFSFLANSLALFDGLQIGKENFHLRFMLDLSSLLGFGLSAAADLREETASHQPVAEQLIQAADMLLQTSYDEKLPIDRQTRSQLTELLLAFYANHLENFGELRSLPVLKALLDG